MDKFEEDCFERIKRALFSRFIIYAYTLLGRALDDDAGHDEKVLLRGMPRA